MTLLSDSEIFEKIGSDQIICEGFRKQDKSCWTTKDSAIQASSLDLHIGQIYIPNEEGKPKYQHCLKPGQTVVIRTREVLDFPNNIAAIGFPPSSMSSKGILTTNPGHIDPGYRGVFHITLINMGKNDYPLKKDDLIVTLLLFKLAKDKVTKGYMQRRSSLCDENSNCPCEKKSDCTDKHAKSDDITETMLDYLAPDFMNFESRTNQIVKRQVFLAGWWKEGIKVFVTILVALGAGFWGYLGIDKRIEKIENIKIEDRIKNMEDRIDEVGYYDKIQLKDKIDEIDKRLQLNEKTDNDSK